MMKAMTEAMMEAMTEAMRWELWGVQGGYTRTFR